MRRLIAWHLVALAAASALFLALPNLDLSVSGLFYRPGNGFYLADSLPVQVLFRLVPWLVTAQLVLIPLVVGVGWWRGRPIAGFDWRAGLFVLTVLALGPGLVVNVILKDHWGRARPVQISEFGGARHFTPAPLAANECDRNCSFTAGHPAVGFALIAYAYLARERRRRRLVVAGAIGLGIAEGFARLAQGGHFLSDVVFSGLLVSMVTVLLANALLEHDGFGALWRRCAGAFKEIGPRWIAAAVLTALTALLSIRYLDRPLAMYLHGIDPDLFAVFTVITDFGLSGGYLVAALLVAAALWIVARRMRDPARAARLRAVAAVPMFLFLSVAMSGLVTDALKIAFGRARPKLLFGSDIYGFTWLNLEPRYWSFPSGHTTTAFAIATALYLLWPRFLPLYAIFAALIAVSRGVTGEHYLSDAIAGGFVGIAATCCVYRAFTLRGINLSERVGSRTRIAHAPLNSP
jgi:lipid A 4'-phosphatase